MNSIIENFMQPGSVGLLKKMLKEKDPESTEFGKSNMLHF